MLKKEFRLVRRNDFLEVKKKTKISWGKYFGIAILPKDTYKVGFVVSKKTFKKAVDRNRFRRVFSQAMREASIYVAGWVVVVAKKESFGLKVKVIKDEILNFKPFKAI